MGDWTEMESGMGPFAGFVLASMISSLALLNGANALTSTETFAVSPAALLSVAEATAWFEIMITTLPSVLITGNTSMSASSEFVNCNDCCPEPDGNICASQ